MTDWKKNPGSIFLSHLDHFKVILKIIEFVFLVLKRKCDLCMIFLMILTRDLSKRESKIKNLWFKKLR